MLTVCMHYIKRPTRYTTTMQTSLALTVIIGVNHGGYRGNSSPSEFGVGMLMHIVPPLDFVMFQNFKDQTACITLAFTMQKNVMPMLAVMVT